MALRRLLLLVSSVLVVCGSFMAQTPPAQTPFSISVNTRMVIQTVNVTDNDGRPIEGLSKDDFILTEDNVPQSISVFEFQKIDDTVSPLRTPPAVGLGLFQPADSNRIAPVAPGDTHYEDRRLLALYFDMKLMSDSDRFRTQAAAYKFITKQMTGADLVAIFTFSDAGLRVRHDFTDDREVLLEVLEEVFDEEAFEEPNFDFGQGGGEFNLFNTDRKLSALQTAVKMLGLLREKKSIIYFSGGLSIRGVDNQAQYRATVNAARRASVLFYPVDSRGLVALHPMGDASRPSPGGIGMYTGATAMATMRTFQGSQDGLYTLAADTGGKALLDYNDLSLGIVAAQRATSSYYLLGYYPTNTAKNGKLRRVKITLKNRSAKLSYRDAYYGDKEFSKFNAYDKERQLEEALMLGDPITELTIAMELNYFQLNRAEYFVPLAVKIPGEELVLAQKAGAEKTVIDFLGEIRNEYGIIQSNIRDKIEIPLKGEAASVLASRHIQYDAGFTLLPGNYVIKFLARNTETGRIGTYQANFTIPNLNKELVRLPISSVVLGSQRLAMTDAIYNAGKNKEAKAQIAHPLIDGGMKLIPSITRVFSRSRDLYVYLQAYERDALTTQPLIALVKFFHEGETPVEIPASIVKDGLDLGSKAVPLKLTVSLNSLMPGEYTCQITVLDTTTQKAAFWQTSIRVVP
jgi:VWFA-related protein